MKPEEAKWMVEELFHVGQRVYITTLGGDSLTGTLLGVVINSDGLMGLHIGRSANPVFVPWHGVRTYESLGEWAQ